MPVTFPGKRAAAAVNDSSGFPPRGRGLNGLNGGAHRGPTERPDDAMAERAKQVINPFGLQSPRLFDQEGGPPRVGRDVFLRIRLQVILSCH